MLSSTLAQSANYKWWAFGAVSMGTFANVVTYGSTGVALPTIAEHFGTDLPTAQWVVIGQVLAISALLLPMGRLSDIVGRKQVYLTGMVIFILSAALAGSSPNIMMLIFSKVLEGSGQAMTQGTSIAIVTSLFATNERGKALGTHMSIVGAGSLTGPALGGLLVSGLGWRWIFYFNILTGLLAIIAVLIVLEKRLFHQEGQRPKFDWLGAALSTGMLLTFLLAISNGYRSGWASPPIVAALLSFVGLLGAFIWWELRTPAPMLDLRVFESKLFSLGVSAAAIAHLGSGSALFLIPFYLQSVLGYSPGQVGLILVPKALATVIVGPVSGRLSDRYGWRIFNVGGLALAAMGMFLLARADETSSLGFVMAAMLIAFLGTATFMSPNTNSIISTVEQRRLGIVSALINLVRNSAQVIGIAVATTIVVATMASMGFESNLGVVSEASDPGVLHAFTSGLRTVFVVMGGLLLLGMVVSAIKGGQPRETLTQQVSESKVLDSTTD